MSDTSNDPNKNTHKNKWLTVNLCLLVLIPSILILPLILRSLAHSKQPNAQQKQLADLEIQLDRETMKNRRLRREVQLAAGDREYLETLARDSLPGGYMKTGETIFRVPPRDTQP